MIELQDKQRFLHKAWMGRKKNETIFYFIFDIVEGGVSYDKNHRRYGLKALEIKFSGGRTDVHFTNSSPTYQTHFAGFFNSLEPIKEGWGDVVEETMQEMIKELFTGKRDGNFFREKYRLKNMGI